MTPPLPAHLQQFKDWLVRVDRKAGETARTYARFLTRCAEHYGVVITEKTVRSDADVQRIATEVGKVVSERDRWGPGTFNRHDVPGNLIPALRAYSRFAQAELRGRHRVPDAKRSQSVMPAPTPMEAPVAEFGWRAADTSPDDVPKRLRTEVSRLVRDSALVREVKAAHGNTCQLCGLTLELAPGRLYSEGHHLKPLGRPHNGPDVKDNLLCVCPNCHVKLDFAAVRIDPAKVRAVPGHSIRREFIEYHNRLCS